MWTISPLWQRYGLIWFEFSDQHVAMSQVKFQRANGPGGVLTRKASPREAIPNQTTLFDAVRWRRRVRPLTSEERIEGI